MSETAKRQMMAIEEIRRVREMARYYLITEDAADARIAELRKVR